jgi:hypothetical protein
MKIELLFSKNKKIGSKLISWASSFEKLNLDEVPSHAAVVINEKLVIESTFFSGVRMLPYGNWKQINNELYKLEIKTELKNVQQVFDVVFTFWGKKYDFKGIFYFAYQFIRFIVFKKQMKSTNKWQRSSHYFCTEVVGKFLGKDLSMVSPAKLYKTLIQNNI